MLDLRLAIPSWQKYSLYGAWDYLPWIFQALIKQLLERPNNNSIMSRFPNLKLEVQSSELSLEGVNLDTNFLTDDYTYAARASIW